MEELKNGWERLVDRFMYKIFGVRGWSWHNKNRIAMMRHYPRYMNRENLTHEMNKRRDLRRFAWLGGVALGFMAGMICGGLTTLSKTYTFEEAIKSPGMVETVITTYPPTKEIPRLPVAADKAPSIKNSNQCGKCVADEVRAEETEETL